MTVDQIRTVVLDEMANRNITCKELAEMARVSPRWVYAFTHRTVANSGIELVADTLDALGLEFSLRRKMQK